MTSTCTADASLQPLGCYFRERVSEPMLSLSAVPGGVVDRPDRIVGERIVDARSAGDTLVVVRADGNGRRERSYAWTAEATFPLLARVSARATGQSVDGVPMFDPATEEISRRSVGGVRRRAVTLDGEMRQVTEIVESGVNTQNSVWLDAAMRTVRREIAGPALVAVPASASTAKGKVGTATIPAALARELDGQFGLWVPNPAWRAEDQIDVGQIRLSCDAHGASIALTRIDHLEAGTGVVMAAEAVANWFRLLQPDLKVVSREHNTIRGRRAIRLIAEGSKARVPQRATVDVIPHHGQFLVLVCQAPKTAWRELAADFAFALQRVEFEPESVEPPLQGPLLQRQKRDQRRRPAARPRPSAAEPKKARELPVVRIPSDG